MRQTLPFAFLLVASCGGESFSVLLEPLEASDGAPEASEVSTTTGGGSSSSGAAETTGGTTGSTTGGTTGETTGGASTGQGEHRDAGTTMREDGGRGSGGGNGSSETGAGPRDAAPDRGEPLPFGGPDYPDAHAYCRGNDPSTCPYSCDGLGFVQRCTQWIGAPMPLSECACGCDPETQQEACAKQCKRSGWESGLCRVETDPAVSVCACQ